MRPETANPSARAGPPPGPDDLDAFPVEGSVPLWLAGVADWFRLCQRCAGAAEQQMTARPVEAEVIPLKSRGQGAHRKA